MWPPAPAIKVWQIYLHIYICNMTSLQVDLPHTKALGSGWVQGKNCEGYTVHTLAKLRTFLFLSSFWLPFLPIIFTIVWVVCWVLFHLPESNLVCSIWHKDTENICKGLTTTTLILICTIHEGVTGIHHCTIMVIRWYGPLSVVQTTDLLLLW